jgi:hypothetical protein
MRCFTATLVSLAVLALAACDPAVIDFQQPSGGGDDAFEWPNIDGGPAIPPPNNNGTCGGQQIPIQLKPGNVPDLHMVVDRSGSMLSSIDKTIPGADSKWVVMQKIIGSMVDQYASTVRFGLTLYPAETGACTAGGVNVPLQKGNSPAIKNHIATAKPTGATPTAPTLSGVRSYLAQTPKGSGPRFVLLATDGKPNCTSGGGDAKTNTMNEVQQLAASGTKVFVLGFGDIVAGDPTFLDQLATAGGAPKVTGPNKFYQATNEQELKDALFKIAGGIIPPPCTYKLNSRPPVPDKVTVKFDGQPIPRSKSRTDGWNYTSNGGEITFYGSFCTKLRQGQVKSVNFVFGCQGPVIE